MTTAPLPRPVQCLAVLLFVGLPAAAAAQTAGTRDCGHENGGTVQGVVVNDRTGVPVSRSYVYVYLQRVCHTATDALGRFVMQHVPAGTHRVVTSASGYRSAVPVFVDVTSGDTAYIEPRLVPGGPLDDCRAKANCSRLLERGSVESDLDDFGFRLVALGTAIALAWETVTAEERWFACLKDEPDAVLDALRDRYGPVAEAEKCEVRADSPGRYGPRLLHVDTARPAFQPYIENIAVLGLSRRTVSLAYFYGPHGGEGWDCDFERTDHGWRPTLCIDTWVS